MLQIICQRLTIVTGLLFVYVPLAIAAPTPGGADASAARFVVHTQTEIMPASSAEQQVVHLLGCEFETSVRFETQVTAGQMQSMKLHCQAYSGDKPAQPYAFYKTSGSYRHGPASIKRSNEHRCHSGQFQIKFQPKLKQYTTYCSVGEPGEPKDKVVPTPKFWQLGERWSNHF